MQPLTPQKAKFELENFMLLLEKIVNNIDSKKIDVKKIPRLISKLEGIYQPISSHILDFFPKSDWYVDGARKKIREYSDRILDFGQVA